MSVAQLWRFAVHGIRHAGAIRHWQLVSLLHRDRGTHLRGFHRCPRVWLGTDVHRHRNLREKQGYD